MSVDPPWLLTCVGVEHDLALLPHFLRHYTALGVQPDRVIVILNADTPAAPGLVRAREIMTAEGVTRAPVDWIAPYTSGTMWEKRGEVQGEACGANDWVLNADVDEFHRWPEPLQACLERAEEMGANCIQGVMIDCLAPGGALAAVQPSPSIQEQFPVRAEVAQAIGGRSEVHGRGGTVKLMARHAHLKPRRGGHRPLADDARYLYSFPLGQLSAIDDPAFRFSIPTQVDHVHWTDTLVARLEKRLATPGVSPAGAEYGQRQLDHIREHGGIALDKIALEGDVPTVPWPERLATLRRMGRVRSGVAALRSVARKALGR